MSIKIINPASAGSSSSSSSVPNLAINGGMDIWQRGISNSVPASTNAYSADRWLIENTSDAAIDASQSGNPVNDGAQFFLSTSFGPGATTGTYYLWQILETGTAYKLNHETASVSFVILGGNNTIQVGAQFFYNATSEVIPTTAIGSEQLFTVNNSTEVLCQLNGQAIGTVLTGNGCIGIRFRVTAVSSGNIHDNSNGFDITKVMLTKSATAQTYQDEPVADTIGKCQRFYVKSYEIATVPGTVTSTGAFVTGRGAFAGVGNSVTAIWSLPISMRASPTVTTYNPNTGATGTWGDSAASAISVSTAVTASNNIVSIGNTASLPAGNFLVGHAVAEAEIF